MPVRLTAACPPPLLSSTHIGRTLDKIGSSASPEMFELHYAPDPEMMDPAKRKKKKNIEPSKVCPPLTDSSPPPPEPPPQLYFTRSSLDRIQAARREISLAYPPLKAPHALPAMPLVFAGALVTCDLTDSTAHVFSWLNAWLIVPAACEARRAAAVGGGVVHRPPAALRDSQGVG